MRMKVQAAETAKLTHKWMSKARASASKRGLQLEGELKKTEALEKANKEHLDAMMKVQSELDEAVSKLETQLAKSDADNVSLKEALGDSAQMHTMNKSLQEELQSLQAELDETSTKLEAQVSQNDADRESMASSLEDSAKMLEANKILKESGKSLHAELETACIQLEASQTELSTAQRKLETTREALNESHGEVDKLKIELEDMQVVGAESEAAAAEAINVSRETASEWEKERKMLLQEAKASQVLAEKNREEKESYEAMTEKKIANMQNEVRRANAMASSAVGETAKEATKEKRKATKVEKKGEMIWDEETERLQHELHELFRIAKDDAKVIDVGTDLALDTKSPKRRKDHEENEHEHAHDRLQELREAYAVELEEQERTKTRLHALEDERKTLLEERASIRRAKMAGIFEAFDMQIDGRPDGEISLDEFMSVGEALHHGKWTLVQNAALHKAMDTDQNGHVILSEFLSFYKSVINDVSNKQFEWGYTHFRDAVKRHAAARAHLWDDWSGKGIPGSPKVSAKLTRTKTGTEVKEYGSNGFTATKDGDLHEPKHLKERQEKLEESLNDFHEKIDEHIEVEASRGSCAALMMRVEGDVSDAVNSSFDNLHGAKPPTAAAVTSASLGASAALEAELRDKKEECKRLGEELTEKDEEIEGLEETIEDLREMTFPLENKIAELLLEREKLEDQLRTIKKQLSAGSQDPSSKSDSGAMYTETALATQLKKENLKPSPQS